MKYFLIVLLTLSVSINANDREEERVVQNNLSLILVKLKDERNKNFLLLDTIEILENKVKKLENQINILKKSKNENNTINLTKEEESNNYLKNQSIDTNKFPKLQMKEGFSENLNNKESM